MVIDYLGIWFIVPLLFIVYFYGKFIHKKEDFFYIGTLLLVFALSGIRLFSDKEVPILGPLITEGNLSFAMFTVVMFGGAFPFRSKPKKYLMQIRREFAIAGFLLLIPHAIHRLDLALSGYNFTGVIAFIIMIPLVIVSYPKVRKRIKAITWKRIHKMAYIVYALIYIHVGFLLFVNDSVRIIEVKWEAWPYHVVFGLYSIMKIRVVILKSKKMVKL